MVWFGCTNACREFSREKAIYQREALFGLCVWAYVLSKVKILSIIGLTELTLFVVLLNHYLSLDISIIPFFIVTFGLYFSGMSLGLMLSRWTGSSGKAVISVPIVIIPQIIFSKFVLPQNTLSGIGLNIEKLMIVKWGYEALMACKTGNFLWQDFFIGFFTLIGLGILFLMLTTFHFWFAKESL